jgi:hypothetical protein
MAGRVLVCTHTFKAEQPDELSMAIGDRIEVTAPLPHKQLYLLHGSAPLCTWCVRSDTRMRNALSPIAQHSRTNRFSLGIQWLVTYVCTTKTTPQCHIA